MILNSFLIHRENGGKQYFVLSGKVIVCTLLLCLENLRGWCKTEISTRDVSYVYIYSREYNYICDTVILYLNIFKKIRSFKLYISTSDSHYTSMRTTYNCANCYFSFRQLFSWMQLILFASRAIACCCATKEEITPLLFVAERYS